MSALEEVEARHDARGGLCEIRVCLSAEVVRNLVEVEPIPGEFDLLVEARHKGLLASLPCLQAIEHGLLFFCRPLRGSLYLLAGSSGSVLRIDVSMPEVRRNRPGLPQCVDGVHRLFDLREVSRRPVGQVEIAKLRGPLKPLRQPLMVQPFQLVYFYLHSTTAFCYDASQTLAADIAAIIAPAAA